MTKGDAEAARELRGYVAVARLGVIAALAGFVAFLLLIRGNMFDADVTSWPLLLAAAVWALGMVAALWARSRVRAWNDDRAASTSAEAAGVAPPAVVGGSTATVIVGAADEKREPDYWHANDADRAAHAAKEAARKGK